MARDIDLHTLMLRYFLSLSEAVQSANPDIDSAGKSVISQLSPENASRLASEIDAILLDATKLADFRRKASEVADWFGLMIEGAIEKQLLQTLRS